MTLYYWPSKHLSTVCEPVIETSEEITKICGELEEVLKTYQAQGIAANQLGYHVRVIAIADEEGNPLVMINPKIDAASLRTTESSEGCLSMPGVMLKLTRAETVTATWSSLDGTSHTQDFFDVQAVAIQHELDHLNGVTMLDRVGVILRRQAIKKLERAKKFLSKYNKIKKAQNGQQGRREQEEQASD